MTKINIQHNKNEHCFLNMNNRKLKQKKTVTIVGYGRFGRVLERLLGNDFHLVIVNKKNPQEIQKAEVVFYCVPISSFERVIKSHKKYFKPNQLLIDVLSVKSYPKKVFLKYLSGLSTQAMLTHPMFGPDSCKNGFSGLPIVINQFLSSKENYQFWKDYFQKKGLKVVELTAEEHDKMAAYSQGVTHFIGRLLQKFNFQKTEIDTLGAKKLQEVMEQTCNDTWQLFSDLQTFNPFTKKMRWRLGKGYDLLYNQLLPKRVSQKYLVFGIQGGKGSFNEEALIFYTDKKNIKSYQIKYLYTTEKVLKNLSLGNIDFGLFAIQNPAGGVVMESAFAMSRYKFKIIDQFSIPICHFLMKRKEVDFKQIEAIMAHPQVFLQCQNNLKRKYPFLKLISGKGDLVDTAKAAEALFSEKISTKIAILGPKRLAEIFDFEIVDSNLQDLKNNQTTFFVVKR